MNENEQTQPEQTNALPKEVIEAKQQGIEVISIETGEKVFYFRKPVKIDVKTYMDAIVRDKNSSFTHTERSVKSLILCNQAEFSAYLEKKPLAIGQFFEELYGDLGVNETFIKKKV